MNTHIRVRNLTWLLQQRFDGVIARLARALDKSPNQVRLFLRPSDRFSRSIGERLARDIEQRLGLPLGCLDIEDENLYHSSVCRGDPTEPSVGNDLTSARQMSRLPQKLYPLIRWSQVSEWCCGTRKKTDVPANRYFPSHKELSEHGFVLRVEDESMVAPGAAFSFPPGMLLYVNPDLVPSYGQFIVVMREGATTASFKRLSLIDGVEFFESLNPNWPYRFLERKPSDVIFGVVVHAGFELV